MSRKTSVFIFNGYGIFGGSYMLYQLGRVCFENFKVRVFIVQEGRGRKGEQRFSYKYHFPTVTIAQMMKMIRKNDVFICNPAQSRYGFGARLPCKKIMYLQGVSSYTALDRGFDYYVCVSHFVQDYVKANYGIDASLIPPYINLSLFQQGVPWEQRNGELLVLAYKNETHRYLNELRKTYNRKYHGGFPAIKKIRNLTHQKFAEALSAHRYYLTLTRVEGFGLPSLEAMASGCVVFGFDAYGGRDYFHPGENAYVVADGDYEALACELYEKRSNPKDMKMIAKQAQSTAGGFSYEAFREKWCAFFKETVFVS